MSDTEETIVAVVEEAPTEIIDEVSVPVEVNV